MTDNRKELEKEYFNISAEQGTRDSINSIYDLKIVGDINNKYNELLFENCSGEDVLEIGCGVYYTTVMLAKNKANVFGIDISDKSIELARKNAAEHGITNINYSVMDAEHLEYENNKFDRVFGTAILHHLNLEQSLKEICRVLKPNGKAVFMEPLGHNPIINLFRKLTPGLRTEDEHPLKKKDIKAILNMFNDSYLYFFYFVSIAAIPFRNTFLFKPLFSLLKFIDKILFAVFPFFRYYAWQVLITLKNPKK